MTIYHKPVMLEESMEALNIDPNGVYVDATFGGGGHSMAILSKLGKGSLIAFDRDETARKNLPDDNRLSFINHDYRYLENFLQYTENLPVSGILADLGVSSHQFDTPERGFSFRFDAPLDMRMDPQSPLSAETIVNQYSPEDLQRIFGQYGEIKNAKELSRLICMEREKEKITSTGRLKEIAEEAQHKRDKSKKYLSQVFQAIRIEVNKELEGIKDFLLQAKNVLAPEGRLVVITYHSLEDRIVKNFLNKGSFKGNEEKDLYGNVLKPFDVTSRKPVTASPVEIEENPRARSARLRTGKRRQND